VAKKEKHNRAIAPDKWQRVFYAAISIAVGVAAFITPPQWFVVPIVALLVYVPLEYAFNEGVQSTFARLRDIVKKEDNNG